jgi:hypothetical protein
MLVVLAAVCLVPATAGAATTNTNITSFADPRGDLPSRSGQLVRSTYGTFSIPANSEIHNVPMSITPPCQNCRITDMVPNLVFTNGNTANMQDGQLLHHFVIFNSAQQGIGCPIAEPFFGAGNERSHLHLPTPYGYQQGVGSWNMITHLVNKSPVPQTLNIEVVYRWRALSETEPARPAWLDIDSICFGGNSEYSIPTGYSDLHSDWTVPQNARILGMSGHLHDIDIIDPTWCSVHCSSKGEAIALSAELIGGPNSDYYGPVPPNNSPPADIAGATMCRSQAYHGSSPFGTTIRANGHMHTTSICGINSGVPAGAQAEAYPANGAYSFEGYPVKAGDVIRLHSEYLNNSGAAKTDVMGIMAAWMAFPDPAYPRPNSALKTQTSLVPAFNQCTAANRQHGPPLASPSCNPPTLSSAQLTVGSASNGSAAVKVQPGNANTIPDEADVSYAMSLTDVKCKAVSGGCAAAGADYTGQLQLRTTLRITDRYNGPSEVGVVQDTPFNVTVPCTATGGAAGSTCSVNTTADAVLAGVVKENRRAIWQLDQVKVFDGGADGVVSTSPNTLFAVQGIFAP